MLGVASPLTAPAPAAAGPASVAVPSVSTPASRAHLQKTMMGVAVPTPMVAPPASQAAPPPAAPAVSGGAKTMLGVMAPQAPAPVAPQAAPKPALGAKTMLGMAAPSAPYQGASPAPARAPAPAAPVGLGGKKTLLGVAAPVAQQQPARGKGHTLVGMPSPTAPGRGKTLLGIAMPVFAPPAEPEYIEEYYDEVVPETGEVERRVRRVEKPAPPLYKRPAFWALAGAGVLLVAGVAIVLFVRSPAPLTAQPKLDATGKDVLHVSCSSCPDGTKIGMSGASATIAKGEADLPLAKPLDVGISKLPLTVDRPNGRSETVNLEVPVAYRIWPELGALEDPVPAVRVMVEAMPGSSVTVQGKPVTLGDGGGGVVKIEVADQLAGLSREAKSLEKDIAYTVATKGGAPESGKLTVRVGIAPLSLESPGAHMVTDQPTFMLAGRTAKGGGLLVAGRPIAVTPDGAFAQLMNISTVGSTEVELRASAPPLAPRLAKIAVRRVAALSAEAKDVEGKATTSYADALAKGDAAVGSAVAWKAEVLQASTQGHQVIAVVNVATGCARRPCQARVVVPGAAPMNTGDKISVYGRIAGLVPLGDAKIPDVEVDFVVKGP